MNLGRVARSGQSEKMTPSRGFECFPLKERKGRYTPSKGGQGFMVDEDCTAHEGV